MYSVLFMFQQNKCFRFLFRLNSQLISKELSSNGLEALQPSWCLYFLVCFWQISFWIRPALFCNFLSDSPYEPNIFFASRVSEMPRNCTTPKLGNLKRWEQLENPLSHRIPKWSSETKSNWNEYVLSSVTDEVVVTHLPLHPLTSVDLFNVGSLFPWRLRQSNQVAEGNNF